MKAVSMLAEVSNEHVFSLRSCDYNSSVSGPENIDEAALNIMLLYVDFFCQVRFDSFF